jgi:hypothetical protein
MAGFAVVMTILFWGFFLMVAAAITSGALVLLAKNNVPQGTQGRSAFLTACGFAPFAGLLWLVAALLIHVEISNKLAHQDCGLSGDPYVTLPNGYVLGSLNTYDGYIRAPGFRMDVPITGPGYVRSIIDIQWIDGSFVGTLHDFNTNKARRFIFNTQDRSIQIFDAGYVIDFTAVQTRVHEDADSYWNLYSQYRHHWPNVVLIVLIIGGEGAIAYQLWRLWNSIQQRATQP